MARRVVRTERVDQPQGYGGGINRSHPFAANCSLAWQASAPLWNAATGQVGARTGLPTVEAGSEGVAQKFAGSQRFDFAGSPTYTTPNNGGLLLCATFTATSGVNSFITGTSTGNNSAHLTCTSTGSFNLFIAGVLDVSFGMTLVAGRLYTGAVFHEGVNAGITRAFLRDHVTGEIKSNGGSGSVSTYNGAGNGRSYVGGFPTQPNYNGRVFQAQHYAGSLPRGNTGMEALMRLIVTNPWQLFEPQTRSVNLAAAAGDVTLALSGLSATADRGALVAALDKAADGLAVTASRGTLSPETAKALTGSSISAQLGTLAAALSVGLTGLQSSVLGGTVTAQIAGDVTVALTGLSASVAAGVTVPAIQITASGQGVSAAAGALAHSRTIALLGAQSAAQGGTLAATGGTVVAKVKGLRKTRYTPGRVPAELAQLAQFLQSEIERITDGLESPFTHQLLEQLTVEPSRKPTAQALIAYADGANWNPGSGEGVYAYYSGSWHLLG